MSAGSRFAEAAREEIWSGGVLLERRLSFGEARAHDGAFFATDRRDDDLVERCDALMAAMRACAQTDSSRGLHLRLVAQATAEQASALIILADGKRSLVSTALHFAADRARLEAARVSDTQPAAVGSAPLAHSLPLVWRGGSAAVLLHEAAGHPLEHGLAAPALPEWLTADVPLRDRRSSFRDIPLLRMESVTLRQHNAPFELPDEHLEVQLVDGGAWDPLTDVVTVRISFAEHVAGNARIALAPFVLAARRNDVLRSLCGAAGEPERYPGVICSREGQELFVASHAPVVITRLR